VKIIIPRFIFDNIESKTISNKHDVQNKMTNEKNGMSIRLVNENNPTEISSKLLCLANISSIVFMHCFSVA
jgi:hypothetical protein